MDLVRSILDSIVREDLEVETCRERNRWRCFEVDSARLEESRTKESNWEGKASQEWIWG